MSITLRLRFACFGGTNSPLPPLAPPSPRWAMEGDFIWPRALRSRARLAVCWDSRAGSALRFLHSGFGLRIGVPHPSGWAEERSEKWIRASDCLSAASSSSTPFFASTAGCPQRSAGTQTIGSPSLCLLSLGEARESESPAGARPGLLEDLRKHKLAHALTGSARTAPGVFLHGSRIKSGMTSRGERDFMPPSHATPLCTASSASPPAQKSRKPRR
jgi:hypothetical protein